MHVWQSKAPLIIQRFGDIERLVEHALDAMLLALEELTQQAVARFARAIELTAPVGCERQRDRSAAGVIVE